MVGCLDVNWHPNACESFDKFACPARATQQHPPQATTGAMQDTYKYTEIVDILLHNNYTDMRMKIYINEHSCMQVCKYACMYVCTYVCIPQKLGSAVSLPKTMIVSPFLDIRSPHDIGTWMGRRLCFLKG